MQQLVNESQRSPAARPVSLTSEPAITIPSSQDASGRTRALDGLRGLAALSVFFCHAQGMLPSTALLETLRRSPVRILWDGAAAVSLFFVLSGFVLALPFQKHTAKRLCWPDFVLRRIFRIYPAYLLALGVSLILRLHGPVLATEANVWFRGFWTMPITTSVLVPHLAMIGPKFNTDIIDPVIWSLIIEMRMSIMMPVFIVMLRHCNVLAEFIVLLAIALLANLTHTFQFAYAAPFFLAGVQLAKHRQSIVERTRGFVLWQKGALAAASFTLYGTRMFCDTGSPIVDYATGAGAVGLIICVLSLPAFKAAASSRVALVLGDVSYSFYLLHLPIMIFVASWLLGSTHSLVACWALSLCGALLISAASNHLLERPFQEIGKQVWPAAQALMRGR
jgi:peptidoglycan/LPS O-acetylase OafA/YrhL